MQQQRKHTIDLSQPFLGGAIVAEATAHAGWITGMDLAIVSGLLVTASEDGFTRVFF